ncbi:hypothetical protein EBR96_03260, partial [bacterium]|nr:hypothetical protein [bacterium]
DGYDLNYFIQYNIDKLELAKRQFKEYLKQKMDENINSMALVKTGYHFNRRQLNLLQYLLKNEQRYTTLKTHLEINDSIKKVTAIQDLSYLVKEGLLTKTRMGRQFLYHPTAKVIKLFNR